MVAQPLTHKSHSQTPVELSRAVLWAEFEMRFAEQLRARRDLDELRSVGADPSRVVEAEHRLQSVRHELAVLRAKLT